MRVVRADLDNFKIEELTEEQITKIPFCSFFMSTLISLRMECFSRISTWRMEVILSQSMWYSYLIII